MAWGLTFVVVLMIVLFVVVVPAIRSGYNNRNYGNRSYDNRGYNAGRGDHRRYDSWHYDDRNITYSQPRRSGCQQMLILVILVFLIFVAAVIYWSVTVQAGGRPF